MKNKKVLSNIAIILTVIFWGISFISIKVCLDVFPPMSLSFIRFFIASILLFIIIKIKEPNTKLDKKDLPLMFIAGGIGVTAYYFFENNGIERTSATAASLIIATIPIFSLIADVLIFKAKLNIRKILGVVVSVVGVYFIVAENLKELFTSSTGIGYLMMIAAVICWVIYSIATKPLTNKYSQLQIVYYQTLFGTLFFTPFIFFEKIKWELINTSTIINLLYLAVFCSAVAYYLYVYALDYLGVSTTSMYINLIPLVTVICGVFILNENIGIYKIIGGVLVMASVYIVEYKGKEKKEKVIDSI